MRVGAIPAEESLSRKSGIFFFFSTDISICTRDETKTQLERYFASWLEARVTPLFTSAIIPTEKERKERKKENFRFYLFISYFFLRSIVSHERLPSRKDNCWRNYRINSEINLSYFVVNFNTIKCSYLNSSQVF